MDDFGAKLRNAREGRGISLRQIASSTRIPVAALEALERNDVSRLPAGVFSRGFVRSYAAEVGLDPDTVLNEFVDRFHGEASATEHGSAPEGELAFERHKQHAARVFIVAVLLMLVISAVVVYVLLQYRPT